MKKQNQLGNQIRKLQYQLSYSQYVNKQLSQQLSVLHKKTGIGPKKTNYDQNLNNINTQAHLRQLYYVEPLLLGYQHKINLMEEQLKVLKEEAEDLNQFASQIVTENVFLRQQLQNKNQYIIKSDQVGINLNFIKLDNDNLKEKLKLITQKNNFLQNQIKDFHQHHKINKSTSDIYTTTQLEKLITHLKEDNRTLQIQKIQLTKNIQIITNQQANQQAINNNYLRKIQELENDILRLKNQVKIAKQQYETYQTTHEGTSTHLEADIATLKSQLQIAGRREAEIFNKNMILESQIQDKNNKCHNLTLQNTQLQTNNNNILQMLETYQVKVSTLNKRIKSLENENKEHSQGTGSFKRDLELMEWKMSEKEREIQRKEIEWKKQRDRISKMWEDRVESLRKALQQERNSLYDEIQSLKSEKVKLELKLKHN